MDRADGEHTETDDEVFEPLIDDEGTEADPDVPVLRVAYARGVNPGKWARIWSERRPDLPLALVRTDLDTQREMLLDGSAALGFVRAPFDRDGLNAIQLYEEVPVVVISTKHPLEANADVRVEELADEQLVMAPLVIGWSERAAELGFEEPAAPLTTDAESAIELVASEVGIAVVPQSVARLHHRSDVVFRPIVDLPLVPISLVWPTGSDGVDIDDFVGVVRGRTANSSRRVVDAETGTDDAATTAPAQAKPGRKKAKPKAGAAKGTPAGTSRGAQLAARKAKGEAASRAKRKRH
ncbi:LysR family substrate-binding domain-containing protein [Plantibacter sp. Mn2098]|uniref:LysR family substrate-binding domain-containing protein n=1 Tax=Plantibacter sp. Mn2098 TaxID=3395266 RepID=UPI003BBC439A